MALPKGLTLHRVMQAIDDGEYIGFCLECGAEREGLEPDARNEECEACGRLRVYGAEEIVLMEM